MKLLLLLFIIALAIIAAVIASFFWSDTLRALPAIGRNPAYISVIRLCTDYDDRKHCGRTFKEILALYDYQICANPDWSNGRCNRYYSPEELHGVLNNLP